MALEMILADESIFLTSGQSDLLNNFLGRCNRSSSNRLFCLYITKITKRRLGMAWYYKFLMPRRKTKELHTKKLTENRETIRDIKPLINKFCLRPKRIYRGFLPNLELLIPFKYQSRIMHLFSYANAKKEEEKGSPLSPAEVIPLETCEIAYIAHTHGCRLISTNRDFDCFSGYCSQRDYINFTSLDSFLSRTFNNQNPVPSPTD